MYQFHTIAMNRTHCTIHRTLFMVNTFTVDSVNQLTSWTSTTRKTCPVAYHIRPRASSRTACTSLKHLPLNWTTCKTKYFHEQEAGACIVRR